jgi:hypothetical protein
MTLFLWIIALAFALVHPGMLVFMTPGICITMVGLRAYFSRSATAGS